MCVCGQDTHPALQPLDSMVSGAPSLSAAVTVKTRRPPGLPTDWLCFSKFEPTRLSHGELLI